MVIEKNVARFDQDVAKNKSYLYTTGKLSSRLANRRISDVVQAMFDLKGKRVIDIGCGDGTYTLEFLEQKPSCLLGIDASREAVRLATGKTSRHQRVQFKTMDIYQIHRLRQSFDVAVVRGLLHHLYRPQEAVQAISKIAKNIIVVEPNGYSPILKVIEKFSAYHRRHEEKSFTARTLNRWFQAVGGRISKSGYYGFVPCFCYDWLARLAKALEPLVEKTPGVRMLACAVYIFRVSMK